MRVPTHLPRRSTRTARAGRVLLVALLAAVSSQALAEPADDARRHFRAGLEAAAANDYATAVDEFLAAYAAIRHPASAFNIARGYEDMGELESAMLWYRQFQTLAPERAEEADEPIRRVREAMGATAVDNAAYDSPDAALARLQVIDAERSALVSELNRMGLQTHQEPAFVVDETAPATQDPDRAQAPSETEAPQGDASAGPREALLTDAYQQVVVTASRYGQDPLDSPSSITVITAEDIRMSGAVHIADVLRRVVGVDVMSMSSGVPYLGIRGFNSEMTNKVLWLVDGRPTALEFLASPMEVSIPVGLDEIERIEIIRGAGSALYGANAVSGVVNILTRRPGEGRRLEGSLTAGMNGLLAGSAVASGGAKRASYRVSAGYQQEGRFEKELEAITEDDPFVSFRRGLDLGDQRVRAAARFDTTFADKGWASLSGGYANGFTEYYSKAALGNFGLQGGVGHVRGDIGYGPFRMRTYWQREDGRTEAWIGSAGAARNTEAYVRDNIVDVEVEARFQAKTGQVEHTAQIGGGYRYKSYRAGTFDIGFQVVHPENHAAVFGQYQLKYRWFQAVASLRWDRHPLLDAATTVSPRGALVFRVAPHTTIRTSAGTAFRAMNGLESYVNLELGTSADGYFVSFGGAAKNLGTPEQLRAERITSVELGARDESSRFHALDVAVYWNRVTDLIDIADVVPSLSYFVPDSDGYPYGASSWTNTGTVYDSAGGEVDATFFPVDGLDLFANVSISRVWGTEPDGSTFVDGGTALVRANAGLLYHAPFRMDFTLSGHYTSGQDWRVPNLDDAGNFQIQERPIPGRVLLVARIAGRIVVEPEIELAATLWNPLGFADATAYREHPDGQIVAPRAYGTVTARF